MLRSSVAEAAASPKAAAANGEKTRVFYALRYFWALAKGHRLRPWRSPLVRWRFETFFGLHAETLTAGQFFGLLWRHRARMGAFLRWAEEMERKVTELQSNRVIETKTDSETL
jgi:hypothetical protein